jgi:PAS domain S-box-containing protein
MGESVVVVADQAGVIRFWSEGAVARFGWTSAQAAGATLDLIVPPEHREAHWRGFRRAMESGKASLDGQVAPFPASCADGEVRETAGRVTLVRDPSGRTVAVVVAFD